eukprot:gene1531-12657_t
MKVAVIGAGCIGTYVSGLFHHFFKEEVILVSRRNMEEIKTIKLTNQIADDIEIQVSQKFKYVNEISQKTIGDCDIVLVCVETLHTEGISKQLKDALKDDACVLSLQNGIGNAETLKQNLPKQYVLPTIVFFNVVKKETDKKSALHFHNGTGDMLLKFGLLPIQDSRKLPEQYSKWIKERAIDKSLKILCLEEEFIQHQYHKLVINLMGSVNCLNGKTIIQTMSGPLYRTIIAYMISEALTVLEAANIKPKSDDFTKNLRVLSWVFLLPNFLFMNVASSTFKIDENAKFSIRQMFEAGKKTEIDDLNGHIVKLGKKYKCTMQKKQELQTLKKIVFMK